MESPQRRNPHSTLWRPSWVWTGENTQNYFEHCCLKWQTMQLIYRKVYACRVWLHSEFSELILWSWYVCSHICRKTSIFTRYWVLYHTPPQIRTSDAIYRLFNMQCLNYVRGIPSGVTKWGLSTVLQIFPDMRANFHDPDDLMPCAVGYRAWHHLKLRHFSYYSSKQVTGWRLPDSSHTSLPISPKTSTRDGSCVEDSINNICISWSRYVCR